MLDKATSTKGVFLSGIDEGEEQRQGNLAQDECEGFFFSVVVLHDENTDRRSHFPS